METSANFIHVDDPNYTQQDVTMSTASSNVLIKQKRRTTKNAEYDALNQKYEDLTLKFAFVSVALIVVAFFLAVAITYILIH